MKVKRIRVEKEDGLGVEIWEREVIVTIRENDTHEQSQYNDIIGETDKYIVSLIKNVDANGKLTWIEIFLTEKDDEQDEKVEKSLAEIHRRRVLELGEKYRKRHSTLSSKDLKKLIDGSE